MSSKIVGCPNCGAQAIREGDIVTCQACDAQYTIKEKEAKVKSIGRLDDHEKRLQALEAKRAAPEPIETITGEPDSGEGDGEGEDQTSDED